MGGIWEFINHISAFFSPVWPRNWWRYAQRLAAGNGWGPPMLLWAIAGIVLPLNVAFGRQQNLPWLERFNLIGFATLAIVAWLAMVMTGLCAATAFRRLGVFGPTRPRWWFEIGRLSLNVATIAFVGLMMGMTLDDPLRQFPVDLFTILSVVLLISVPMFLVTATTGYLVSFVFGMPRTGRAYDGVHYFYSLIVPIGILAYTILQFPPQPKLAALIVPVTVGVLAIAWLLMGFLSIIQRYEAREHRQQSL